MPFLVRWKKGVICNRTPAEMQALTIRLDGNNGLLSTGNEKPEQEECIEICTWWYFFLNMDQIVLAAIYIVSFYYSQDL